MNVKFIRKRKRRNKIKLHYFYKIESNFIIGSERIYIG